MILRKIIKKIKDSGRGRTATASDEGVISTAPTWHVRDYCFLVDLWFFVVVSAWRGYNHPRLQDGVRRQEKYRAWTV